MGTARSAAECESGSVRSPRALLPVRLSASSTYVVRALYPCCIALRLLRCGVVWQVTNGTQPHCMRSFLFTLNAYSFLFLLIILLQSLSRRAHVAPRSKVDQGEGPRAPVRHRVSRAGLPTDARRHESSEREGVFVYTHVLVVSQSGESPARYFTICLLACWLRR